MGKKKSARKNPDHSSQQDILIKQAFEKAQAGDEQAIADCDAYITIMKEILRREPLSGSMAYPGRPPRSESGGKTVQAPDYYLDNEEPWP